MARIQPMPGMVSTIMCTSATPERMTLLADAVHSILESNQTSQYPWELVIVDNSQDGRLESWTSSIHGPIRWIHEPTPGLSWARNRGMAEARGTYLAFVDDDVLVSPGWMDRMVQALALAPGAGCVAGRIVLQFESPAPRWLSAGMHGLYSSFDRGATCGLMTRDIEFYGANFLITQETAQQVGNFNTALGRVGKSLLSGEDTEYANRVTAAGIPMVYSSQGWLLHRVPASRLTLAWILRRVYWGGLSAEYLLPMEERKRNRGLHRRTLMLRVPRTLLALLYFPFSPKKALRRILIAVGLLGRLACPNQQQK